MKQIHIAFLTEYIYALFNPHWDAPFGGAEVDLYNLAVYLAKNPRYRVTLYVGDFGQTDEMEIYQNVRIQKIKLFGRPKENQGQRILFYAHLWKTLWSSDADIIFTKMAGHLVGWAAIFFKVLKKNKVLFHRLASDRDTTFTEPSLSGGRRIYYLYRYGIKKADVVFSQTKQQQRLLKERLGVESRIVPNGFMIDPTILETEKEFILWVGRCAPVKQPDLFIELAKRVPEKEFLMIMPAPSIKEKEAFRQQATEWKEMAEQLPNMTFIEFVPFSEVQAYYNRAQLFVNTSLWEGFPNTFIQSCIGGTPIASLKVDPDGFITNNHIGICCEDRFETLVEFVAGLTEEKTIELGRNALEYVKQHHDIKMTGRLYEEIIKTLMADEHARQNSETSREYD